MTTSKSETSLDSQLKKVLLKKRRYHLKFGHDTKG